MTHNRPQRPPCEQWPSLALADCPTCRTDHRVRWIASANRLTDGAPVQVWLCAACQDVFTTPVTRWPVLDGPDCPIAGCGAVGTRWDTIDPTTTPTCGPARSATGSCWTPRDWCPRCPPTAPRWRTEVRRDRHAV